MIPWGLLIVVVVGNFVLDDQLREIMGSGRVPPVYLIGLPIFTAIVMLLAAPATAALYNSALEMEELEPITLRQFGRGFKRYFFVAWRLALIDLYILYALVLAFIYYRAQTSGAVQILAIVALYPILFWLMIQPYLFPLLIRTERGILPVFRNASVLAIGNFGNTMGLLIITLISLIGLVPLNVIAIAIGPEVVAMTGLRTVRGLLDKYELQGGGRQRPR